MKRLLTALCLLYGLFANSQKVDSIIFDPSGFDTEKSISLPFAGMKVIDIRFDRSNIGCLHKYTGRVRMNSVKIPYSVPAVLPDSFQRYLPKFLTGFIDFSPGNNDTLVMLVKQFRIIEHTLNGINQQFEPQLLLKVSASFFRLRQDSLFRISTINDLLSVKWKDWQWRGEDANTHRQEAFVQLMAKLFEGKRWQANGPAFSLATVNDGLAKRFQFALYTDTVLQAGVYRNFKEFKDNRPSAQNVRIELRRGIPVGLTDSMGKTLSPGSFWGVCTGKKRYLIFRNDFCELIPSDHSFRFVSYMQTNDLFGQPSFGDYAPQQGILRALIIKATDNDVQRQAFYLNMDEEEVYLEEIFGTSRLKTNQKEFLK